MEYVVVNALYLSQFSDQVFPVVNLCKHFLILHHKNMFIEGKNILLIFFECVFSVLYIMLADCCIEFLVFKL